MELTKLHNSSRNSVPTLNTQRQNWRSPALSDPQGTPCCHSEWVLLRGRSSRAWLYTVLVMGMTNQVQKSIRSCTCCLQHEGNLSKVPLYLIVFTTPMDLLHVDFTSIETTMEPNRLSKVANILVFKDHFTRHVMAYVTLIRLQRPLPSFCTRVTSQSLEHWPGS